MTTAEPVKHDTPAWAVVVLGTLLLPLAAAAFTLSFVQLLPVMLFGGWTTSTAWLGPVVLDVTAAAGAVMHVVSRDKAVKLWGLALLLLATVLSILGNLAGHSIRTPTGAPRSVLPEGMAGWVLPSEWQWVVMLLSIAAPTFVAVLVHAFGSVLMTYLDTRPAAVESGRVSAESVGSDPTGHPTVEPTATRLDPTGSAVGYPTDRAAADPTYPTSRPDSVPTAAPDSHPTPLAGPAESGQSGRPDSVPDSAVDQRESAESGTRPDPTEQPTGDPTARRVGYPTPDPTGRPDPTPESGTDPTRPDSESAPDSQPTDPDLTRLVEEARAAIGSGRAKATADSLRVTLGVGSARAREIRDILKEDQRHGLRAVG